MHYHFTMNDVNVFYSPSRVVLLSEAPPVQQPQLNLTKTILLHPVEFLQSNRRVTACPQTKGSLTRNKTIRAALITPLLWKIISNSIKRRSHNPPPPPSMFLPLSLWLLIRCLNLLQNNSAGKEIKGC